MTPPYIGQTFPAKVISAPPGSNLFAIAARELGDATQWNRIAELNGLVDPWIQVRTDLRIPVPGTSNGGILRA